MKETRPSVHIGESIYILCTRDKYTEMEESEQASIWRGRAAQVRPNNCEQVEVSLGSDSIGSAQLSQYVKQHDAVWRMNFIVWKPHTSEAEQPTIK